MKQLLGFGFLMCSLLLSGCGQDRQDFRVSGWVSNPAGKGEIAHVDCNRVSGNGWLRSNGDYRRPVYRFSVLPLVVGPQGIQTCERIQVYAGDPGTGPERITSMPDGFIPFEDNFSLTLRQIKKGEELHLIIRSETEPGVIGALVVDADRIGPGFTIEEMVIGKLSSLQPKVSQFLERIPK